MDRKFKYRKEETQLFMVRNHFLFRPFGRDSLGLVILSEGWTDGRTGRGREGREAREGKRTGRSAVCQSAHNKE